MKGEMEEMNKKTEEVGEEEMLDCAPLQNAYSIIHPLWRKQKLKRANLSLRTLVRLASGDSLSPTQYC